MADEQPRMLRVVSEIAKALGYDDVDLKPISSGGANYTSRLFSITLSSPEKNDLKLFSKVASFGEKVRSMSDTQLYEIEIIFYDIVAPKFRLLEDVHNIPEGDRLVLPKYYAGIRDYGEELMILEDLTAKGFKSFDRFKCFDWEYASKCIEALAKFHALSVAYEKQKPEEYADFIAKLRFNSPKDAMAKFINKSIETALQSTEESHKARVERFLRTEMEKETFVKFFNPERKLLLTHGDFRPSNILQRVDNVTNEGNLQLAMVDYQMIKQGNPVSDLIYFLICGSDEEFRGTYLNQYFDHYYGCFRQALQRLGIDPDTFYSEIEFREDVKQMLPFGLVLATFCLLFVTVEEENAPKPEGFDLGTFDIKASHQFQIRFNALVRDYLKFGIL